MSNIFFPKLNTTQDTSSITSEQKQYEIALHNAKLQTKQMLNSKHIFTKDDTFIESTPDHPTLRQLPFHSSDSFNLNGLFAIADDNNDKSLSMDELSKASTIVDIDHDSKLSEPEIGLGAYIAMKDKHNGFNERERDALNKITHLVQGYHIKLTPENVQQLKYRVDNLFKHLPKPTNSIDLNKNHKVDHFEQIADRDFGVNSHNTNIEQMVNIADSNGDGKVNESEFNKVKKFLDLNSDKKVVKNEFDLNEHIAQLNHEDGFQYPEEIIASTLQYYLRKEKSTKGKPFDINPHNLEALKGGATGMYDMLINIGDTGSVNHEQLWKGTIPSPEIRGQAIRQVSRQEFNDVIDQKTPLEHVDMNYAFKTGPDDYTKRMLNVMYERIASGKMTEEEGKQRYIDIITIFRKSSDIYAQHEVTPWRG